MAKKQSVDQPQTRSLRERFHGANINLFYVPALVLLALFLLYPLVSGFAISLTSWDGYNPERLFVGLSNYVTMLHDANFRMTLINTLIYGIGSTIIQQVLGLGLALLLNAKIRGRTLMRAVIYLPALVSAVIMGTMYYFIFQYQQGALNAILVAFGLDRVVWFQDPHRAVLIIVLVNSLQFVGTSMIIYLAGLQGMDRSVVEAASLDGATGWTKFINITMPMLMPAFTTSVVLNLIGGLKLFDVIKVLTGGGPGYSTNSVSTYISIQYFDNQNAGYAAAMGVVLFLIIAAITTLLNKGLGKLDWES
ncbi:carbohydrate ABC transporter permease [Bifidobacterium castoris]|uniref:ABC transporter permease n=1 Tax=Bifidobacterium castoris TaxID=2306972 RepID=A0A430F8M5_9BIFI|nr:sugar ABC transporter permease [Bifidobacterium castoris]MDE5641300.1 sugar ABC transporter permease [Bifidobacterium castoris]RSX49184.1 ABC transporter permease [Bifidobacterium castoris]